jgi:hypothetical protein
VSFDRDPAPRFKRLELNRQTTTFKEKKERFKKRDTFIFRNSSSSQNTLLGEVADFDGAL